MGTVLILSRGSLALRGVFNHFLLFAVAVSSLFVSNAYSQLPAFREFSAQSGLNFSHQQSSQELSSIAESLGSGVCVEDFNSDGMLDVFLVGGSGFTREYGKESWWHEVTGHGLFLASSVAKDTVFYRDVSKESDFKHSWGMGCAVSDFDQDGKPDLVVLNRGVNHIYRNLGDGRFVKQGFDDGNASLWSTSASIYDVNQDGLPDIYVTNYINYAKEKRVFESSRGFDPIIRSDFDASLYDSQSNQLLINKGDFKFVDQAQKLGVSDSSGRSLGSVWVDVSGDKASDLIVVNDAGSLSRVFVNKGERFESASDVSGLSGVLGNRQLVAADILGNSELELLLSTAQGFSRKVLRKEGDGFRDLAWDLGLATSRTVAFSGWGLDVADFNADGLVDFIYASGQAVPDLDSTHVAGGQANQIFMGGAVNHFGLPTYSQGFQQSPIQSGLLSHRSVATADFDNDGDIDWLVTANNGPVSLWLNMDDVLGSNKWLGVRAPVGGEHHTLQVVFNDNSVKNYSLRPSPLFMGQRSANVLVQWRDEKKIDKIYLQGSSGEKSVLAPELGYYYRLDGSKLIKVISSQNDSKGGSPWLSVKLKESLLGGNTVDISRHLLFTKAGTGSYRGFYQWALDYDKAEVWPYVVTAIQVGDTELKGMAVDWIKRNEPERGVNTLIELLSDSQVSTLLRCNVAKVLEHFYREEEAVIHRKYLAVPALLGLLTAADDELQICAIDALAEAEAFRAIEPLAQLLNTNTKNVRLSAAYALGRIRHQSSEKAVVEAIQSARDADMKIMLLITLLRINSEHFSEYLKKFFDPQKNSSSDLDALVVALNTNEEGRLFLLRQVKQLWVELLAPSNVTELLTTNYSNKAVSSSVSSAWKSLLANGGDAFNDTRVLELCEQAPPNSLDVGLLPEKIASGFEERILNCTLRQKMKGVEVQRSVNNLAKSLLASGQDVKGVTLKLLVSSGKVLLFKPLMKYLTSQGNDKNVVVVLDELCSTQKSGLKTRFWMIKVLTKYAIENERQALVESITSCGVDDANEMLYKALASQKTTEPFGIVLAWYLMDLDHKRVGKLIVDRGI